jgi:hypothetical protein
VVGDNVCHSLGVCGRTRAAAPDGVMHLCQFVGDSVGNVGTGGCSAVSTQDDTVFEVDRHAVGLLMGCLEMVIRELQLNSHRGSEAR